MKASTLAILLLAGAAASLGAQDGGYLYAGKVLAGGSTETSWRLTGQRDLVGVGLAPLRGPHLHLGLGEVGLPEVSALRSRWWGATGSAGWRPRR